MIYQPDLIFDVGMHLGEDTDFYLKKGFRVVGFEANPTLVNHCRARFSEAVESRRLVIVEGAVAPGTKSTVPFYVNLVKTQWGTLNPDWVLRNKKRGALSRIIEVRRIDLVDFLHEHGMPYYLKIDIEGLDLWAVSVLKELKDRPQFVSIETEINSFPRLRGEIDMLRSLGYEKFKSVQQKTVAGTRIESHARDGATFEHIFECEASGPFGDDLPGEWLDHKATLRAYRMIFAKYWIVGHLSPAYRWRLGLVQRCLQRVIGVAGWHDLHARF
jgi:FkbM family methyltransferase